MKEKQGIKLLGIICFLVYFTSYITRINYGAVISEIVAAEGILKSQAGIVTTCSFISYGFGQIVSGILGDKLNPRKLILLGLLATSVCNVLMPVWGNVYYMAALWFMNGFAQAFMWPPLVKILTLYLDEVQFKKTCVNVTLASAIATVAIYLLSPLCISLAGWKLVFVLSAAAGLITAAVWVAAMAKINRLMGERTENAKTEKIENTGEKNRKLSFSVLLSSGVVFIGVGIILQGLLRDGITTWMPSFVSETFQMGSSISILTTVVLPLFSIVSIKLTSWIHMRWLRDEVVCAAVIFTVGFASCLLLSLFYSYSMILAVLIAAVGTGCMHGVNLMLIGMVPSQFKKYNLVSTMSGFLNSLTYIGSAVSSYGIAKLSEIFGWSFTLFSWAATALLGTLVCWAAIKKWKKFKES